MKKLLNKEMGFMLGVLAYLAILMASNGKLSPASKAMPVAVSVICFAMIVLKALFILRGKESKLEAEEETEAGRKKATAIRSTIFILWMISFAVFVNMIGWIPTLVVWLFVLLYFVSKATILQSVVLTLCTSAFVYGMFVRVLHVRFPTGLLF